MWLIISTLLATKMSCMLKYFRSCVSAGVEQLCLLAKLWHPATTGGDISRTAELRVFWACSVKHTATSPVSLRGGDCTLSSRSWKLMYSYFWRRLQVLWLTYLAVRSALSSSTRRWRRCRITADLSNAFVLSRLDYCNSLLAGLPCTSIEQLLQRVQNAAARLVLNLSLRDHVTPALKQLHWLPVEHRVK